MSPSIAASAVIKPVESTVADVPDLILYVTPPIAFVTLACVVAELSSVLSVTVKPNPNEIPAVASAVKKPQQYRI